MMSEKTTHVAKSGSRAKKGWQGKSSAKLVRTRGNAGQGMVEYALLVVMVMILLLGSVGVFMAGIGDFYMNLIKIIVLPFP